jgi:beta-N-acetylhexosaminidase
MAVDGVLPDLRGVPVIRFLTGANIAVGQVPWGLPLDGSVQGGRHSVDVAETTDVEEVVREAMSVYGQDGSPVVVLVRDAHRHPWVVEALRRLDEWTPHLVTVEMGWPGSERLPGRTRVRTYGATRASSEALDEVLAGTGPDNRPATHPPVTQPPVTQPPAAP